MFGVGWTEMLVLGVVALIVIGPKDLPVVMRRLGKALSTIRKMGSEFQRELNKATGLDQVTDIRRSITEPLKQTAAEIRNEFNKPLPGGGVAPSGVVKPTDPKVESVVDAINEKVGLPPATPKPAVPAKAAPPAKTTKPIESPAPAEAVAPAKKPRKSRAKPKPVEPKPAAPKATNVAEAKPKTPAAPRKRRAKPAEPEA
jgi:sec-independent protein translocase protein TatB